MLSLKPEDEKRLDPEAVNWFSARRAEIQSEVPLEELTHDDLNTFLLTNLDAPLYQRTQEDELFSQIQHLLRMCSAQTERLDILCIRTSSPGKF